MTRTKKHGLRTIRKLACTSMLALLIMSMGGCAGGGKQGADAGEADTVSVPSFSADSAYKYVAEQCAFGPRTMNSAAHDKCGDYIAARFRSLGLEVSEQRATIAAFDGTQLKMRNIIARLDTSNPARILICAHWDSRPWADNDPDEANHRKPVMAANDGASGVAVMLELARLMSQQHPAVGIDFVCFDAEDYGAPSWAEGLDEQAEMNSWCLGSQYFAANLPAPDYSPRYAILLDMVGGRGAHFYQEGFSRQYAAAVVDKVWAAAERAGYSSFFVQQQGGYVTDDHGPLNSLARIPSIDIIPYYDTLSGSGFGPTWHTLSDTLENIDPKTLKAVGQTVLQAIYEETV